MKFKVKLLKPDARLPTKAHPTDAGWDLYAPEDFIIKKGGRTAIPLGISVEMPSGFFASFRDRSGLAAKHGLHVLAGVIDSGYTGEWIVMLQNLGEADYEIKKGDRVAQAIVHEVLEVEMDEVSEVKESERGTGGFGSSGK